MIITIESIVIEPEAACDIYRATHLKRENHLGSRPLWKDLGTNLPRDGSRPELKRGHVGEYTENRRRVEEWHRGAQSERLAHEDESEREPSGEHATRTSAGTGLLAASRERESVRSMMRGALFDFSY